MEPWECSQEKIVAGDQEFLIADHSGLLLRIDPHHAADQSCLKLAAHFVKPERPSHFLFLLRIGWQSFRVGSARRWLKIIRFLPPPSAAPVEPYRDTPSRVRKSRYTVWYRYL